MNLDILETSFDYPPLNLVQYRISTYESDIPFVLRFMIDKGVVGGGWIEVHKGKYNIIDDSEKNSNCQLELDLAYLFYLFYSLIHIDMMHLLLIYLKENGLNLHQ